MIKTFISSKILLGLISTLLLGAVSYAGTSLVIDSFDDMSFKSDISKKAAWYTFGNSSQKIDDVNSTVQNNYSTHAGKKYLNIKGNTTNWFVGGIGKEIKKDITAYTDIKLMIYGNGKKSGKLMIELYDDDNNNDKTEMDSNFYALKDDKWAFELPIDWKGWRVITIPLSDFKDQNPDAGDNTFNPVRANGSAGLLSFQFIFLTQDKSGEIKFGIDEIKLIDSTGSTETMIMDNFEDGQLKTDYAKTESWWSFGKLKYTVSKDKTKDPLSKYTGAGTLKLEGQTSNWYIGGFGKYLAVDGSQYKMLKLMIYGYGKNSGVLNIELYDDDNATKQLEQDSNFNPLYDDKWSTSINVNWKGWKAVSIPFYKFKDRNKTIGDNIFNIDHKNGSGGLLHLQLTVNAPKKIGSAHMLIDNIRLVQ